MQMSGSVGDELVRGTGLELVVYLRESASSAATERQQAVLDRLDALADAGTVEDVTVRRWPKRVSERSEVLETVRELREAAEERGFRLEPFFEERERVPGFFTERGDPVREVVLPVVCIALYRDGEVRGVYPCADDETYYSVDDGLDALEGAVDHAAGP